MSLGVLTSSREVKAEPRHSASRADAEREIAAAKRSFRCWARNRSQQSSNIQARMDLSTIGSDQGARVWRYLASPIEGRLERSTELTLEIEVQSPTLQEIENRTWGIRLHEEEGGT